MTTANKIQIQSLREAVRSTIVDLTVTLWWLEIALCRAEMILREGARDIRDEDKEVFTFTL